MVRPQPLPRILAIKEAAEYLHVGPMTLWRLAQRGEIPAFRVGWGWRFSVETLDRWRFEQEHANVN